MGSGSSKESSPAADARGSRSRALIRVFNSSSSCFGIPPTLPDDDQGEEEASNGKNCSHEGGSMSGGEGNGEEPSCRKLGFPSSHHPGPGGKHQDGIHQADSSAAAGSSSSTTASGRIRSRFTFNPAGLGLKLGRTASLGSSAARTRFASTLSAPESDGAGGRARIDPSAGLDDGNYNTSEALSTSGEMATNNADFEIIGPSHGNHADHENYFEARRSSRRHASHESLEGSVRFSRTLSVGRLRDRVLRGASLSEGLFGPASLEERPLGPIIGQPNGGRVLGSARRVPPSHRSNDVVLDSLGNHAFHRSNSMDGGRSQYSDIPQLREAGNRDLLEHRSAFLERRRRIRSQVRALQRLGSRFENLSGHDRSCVLSGQHRSGRCTCRMSNRPVNPDDDMSTRASISRIVMLAEALFEVLDEIHQQSVVLSSRPSFSSIGSVPAPREVVECMPLKIYMKPQKHQNEEAEQCYICLVEYEEGDCMRILPCNHEFHQMCIDKWLKEIHRVCPLCRGDVCRTDTSKYGET